MVKIGNFRGIPAYRINNTEWQSMSTRSAERIFVVDDDVFYHDVRIASLNSRGQLEDFDENMFSIVSNEWRRKSGVLEDKEDKEETAAVEVKEDDTPEPETVETGDGIVDEFMSSWRSNIDDEIEKMKKMSEELEKKYREVS